MKRVKLLQTNEAPAIVWCSVCGCPQIVDNTIVKVGHSHECEQCGDTGVVHSVASPDPAGVRPRGCANCGLAEECAILELVEGTIDDADWHCSEWEWDGENEL